MPHPSPRSPEPHRLVIVGGGGVAGLDIATRLAGARTGDRPLAVTLVDREPAHVWKPMLHTIAAGTSDAGAQQTVHAAQARHHGFAFQPGEATGIDRDRRVVALAPLSIGDEDILPARTIPYDTLVLAVGSRADDFGTAGVAEHCATIDSRAEAIRFNDRPKVVLIEAGPRILAPFPERLAAAARERLESPGVTVRTDARVASVDATGFHLEGGETIAAGMTVRAAGVKAPPLIDSLAGMERARSGRLAVGPTLATPAFPSHPEPVSC